MYAIGILKMQIVSLPMVVQPTDMVDKLVYQRFLINGMSAEEIMPLFSP